MARSSGVGGSELCAGAVNSDGTIAKGAGFTVTHLGAGSYQVTFLTPMASVPIVVVSSQDFTGGNRNFVSTTGAATTGFLVNTGAPGVALVDMSFSFVAIAS